VDGKTRLWKKAGCEVFFSLSMNIYLCGIFLWLHVVGIDGWTSLLELDGHFLCFVMAAKGVPRNSKVVQGGESCI